MPLGGGFLIATFVTVTVSTLPWPIALVACASIAAIAPLFLMKEVTPYLLAVYVFAVFVEGRGFNIGKYITSDPVANPEWVIQTLGVPAGEPGLRIYPSDLILIVLVALWLGKVAARKHSIHLPRIGYLAVAYLAWATATSLFTAPYVYLSLSELLHQYKYFLLYLCLVNTVTSQKVLKATILALLLVVLVEGALTVRNMIYPSGETEVAYTDRTSKASKTKRAGGLHSPQVTAFAMESTIPLAVMLFVTARQMTTRWPLAVVILLGTVALYGAHSRASWIGVTVGLGVLTWLLVRRGVVPRWQLLTLMYAILIILGVFGPKLATAIVTYMWARPESFYGRFESMDIGLPVIADNLVAGVGVNNSTIAKLQVDRRDPEPFAIQYLVVVTETGVVGLMLYVAFFGCTALAALRLSRSRDPDIAFLAMAIFAIYVSLGVHILADQLVKVAAAMVWIYGGVVMALRRVEDVGGRDPVSAALVDRLDARHLRAR